MVHAQNGLLAQSWSDLRGESHPDGWGIAFYENSIPEVERHATPAYESLHFSVTAEQVYARTVLAHVRRATVGGPSLTNAHPFTYGPWAFAHNGTVRRFDRVGSLLERDTTPRLSRCRRGTTDSEMAFYWLLSQMERAGQEPERACSELPRLVEIVGESVRCLARLVDGAGAAKPAILNFILTDGDVLVATRWGNTLYWEGRGGICDCEICSIPHVHHSTRTDYRAVVVASEPISHEPWREMPERTLLSVDGQIEAQLQPI